MIMQATPAAIKDRPAPLNLIALPFADQIVTNLRRDFRIVVSLISGCRHPFAKSSSGRKRTKSKVPYFTIVPVRLQRVLVKKSTTGLPLEVALSS